MIQIIAQSRIDTLKMPRKKCTICIKRVLSVPKDVCTKIPFGLKGVHEVMYTVYPLRKNCTFCTCVHYDVKIRGTETIMTQ